MNTTKTGTRSVLAAAAAAALVLGSAGSAVAHPGTGKGPKSKPSISQADRLAKVDIQRHKKIDLADADAAGTVVRLRATVWDPDRDDAQRKVSLTLGVFTKKVNGKKFQLAGADAPDSAATPLALRSKDTRKVKRYSAKTTIGDLWTAEQIGLLATELKPGDRAFICISAADVTPAVDKYSRQTSKRLGMKADGSEVKRTVRDCVKVVDSTVG